MTQSVKQRVAGTHLGNMDKKQLIDLLLSVRSDLNSLNTVVGNLVSAVGNVQTTANSLVSDVQKISNNTNAANNTVQVSATAATTNLNALSALNTAT